MKPLLVFFCVMAGLVTASAQIPDSIIGKAPVDTFQLDSMSASVDTLGHDTIDQGKRFVRFFTKDYPDPKKALTLSLIVPGAGQIYNKKPWKLVFVYGALAGLGYLIDYNTDIYLDLKLAYRREVRGLPHKYSDVTGYSAATIKSFRDKADKNRQFSYIGFFAVYALNGVEAFVDAHLSTFDVDDDISLQLKPSIEPTGLGQPALGVGIRWQFFGD